MYADRTGPRRRVDPLQVAVLVDGGTRFETDDHAKCSGRAATRRTDEHKELGVFDLELKVVDGFEAVPPRLVHLFEWDWSYESLWDQLCAKIVFVQSGTGLSRYAG